MATLLLVPIWLTLGLAAWTTFVVLGLRFEPEGEAATFIEA